MARSVGSGFAFLVSTSLLLTFSWLQNSQEHLQSETSYTRFQKAEHQVSIGSHLHHFLGSHQDERGAASGF
ncbi:unnamed protein product, partial [Closterium sp. NIES-53]